MDKVEIYKWLKSQKYPTGYDEVGEYLMYYSVDMPEILEDYYAYKVKKLNEPDVSGNEVKVCPICGKPFYYLYNKDYYQQECECDLSGQTYR